MMYSHKEVQSLVQSLSQEQRDNLRLALTMPDTAKEILGRRYINAEMMEVVKATIEGLPLSPKKQRQRGNYWRRNGQCIVVKGD